MKGSTVYLSMSFAGMLLIGAIWQQISEEAQPVPEIIPIADRLSLFSPTVQSPELQQTISFTDKTFLSGLTHRHTQKKDKISSFEDSLGAGVCVADFNNDGWDDLFFVSGSGNHRHFGRDIWWQDAIPNQFYRNENGEYFTNITDEFDFKKSFFGIACAIADLNNDGWVDIIVANKGANLIYENLGDGIFTVHETAFTPEPSLFSTSVLVDDVNGDGKQDVLFGNYVAFTQEQNVLELNAGFDTQKNINFDPALYDAQPDTLFINSGDFTFELSSKNFEPNRHGRTLGFFENEQIIALNDKGSPSQIISELNNSSPLSSIVVNARDAEKIESPAKESEPLLLFSDAIKGGIFAFSFKDKLLNDKSWDLAINDEQRLYANTWSILTADFNLDGNEDLYLANGSSMPHPDTNQTAIGQNNILLKANRATRQFEEQPQENERVLSARGGAVFDFNLDGKMDVVISNNNDYPSLLLNTTNTDANWIGIKCIPVNKCQHAQIEVNGKKYTDPFAVKQAFGSQSALSFNAPIQQPQEAKIVLVSESNTSITITGKNQYFLVDLNTKEASSIKRQPSDETDIPTAIEEYIYLLNKPNRNARATVLENRLQDIDDNNKLLVLEALKTAQNRQFFQLADLWSGSENTTVAVAAIDLLKDLEMEQSIPGLLNLTRVKNEQIACQSIKTFQFFYWKDEAAIERKKWAESALIKILNETSTKKTACAIDALAESESYRALAPLTRILNGSDDYLSMKAARALGMLRQTEAAQSLKQTMVTHQSPFVRAESLIALTRLAVDLGDVNIQDIKTDDKLFNAALIYSLQNADDGVAVNQLIAKLYSANLDANYKIFSRLSNEELFKLYRLMTDRMKQNAETIDQELFQVLEENQFTALDDPNYVPLIAKLGDSQKLQILQGMQPDRIIQSIGNNSGLFQALCNFDDKNVNYNLCAAHEVKDQLGSVELSSILRSALNSGNYYLANALSLLHHNQRAYGIAFNQLINDSRLQSSELLFALRHFVIKPENFGNIQTKLHNFSDAEQLQILRNVQRHATEKDFTLWIKDVAQSANSEPLKFFSLTYIDKYHKEQK